MELESAWEGRCNSPVSNDLHLVALTWFQYINVSRKIVYMLETLVLMMSLMVIVHNLPPELSFTGHNYMYCYFIVSETIYF